MVLNSPQMQGMFWPADM